MRRDKRNGFRNIVDLKYVNDYVLGPVRKIIDAVYLHIPMHSPVDRAAIEHMYYRYKPQTRRARAR